MNHITLFYFLVPAVYFVFRKQSLLFSQAIPGIKTGIIIRSIAGATYSEKIES